MKQYLFITGMVAILLAGCQKGQVEVSERTFSDETSEYRISAKHAIFSSTDEKVNQACQEMNQAVAEYVESATEQFRTEATGMRRELAADDMKCPVWVSEFHLEDSVFITHDAGRLAAAKADSIEYVENLIVDEMAAETAFEGNRFFDLMRIARHRGQWPAWAAEKVAVRFGDGAEAIRSRLQNEDAWFLR